MALSRNVDTEKHMESSDESQYEEYRVSEELRSIWCGAFTLRAFIWIFHLRTPDE